MKGKFLRGLFAALGLVIIFNVVYFAALRAWHVRWGATGSELSATLPGDELFLGPQAPVTHDITINAPPQDVWPWIRQIGQDRSGFYSYTPLENLVGCQMPRVHQVDPSWRERAIGETVWFATPKHYRGQAKMIAAVVQPERAFAMVTPRDWERLHSGGRAQETLWAFTLKPIGVGQTRLIARLRGAEPRNVSQRLISDLFWEPAHFVMERKMLITIKKLAEHQASAKSGQNPQT